MSTPTSKDELHQKLVGLNRQVSKGIISESAAELEKEKLRTLIHGLPQCPRWSGCTRDPGHYDECGSRQPGTLYYRA